MRFFVGFLFLVHVCLFGKIVVSAAESSSDVTKTCENDNNKIKINELWSMGPMEASEFLGGIYEYSQWVANLLLEKRPYHITTVTELAKEMKHIVDTASQETKIELINSHPDLTSKIDVSSPLYESMKRESGQDQYENDEKKELTADSQEEQSLAGLQNMSFKESLEFHMTHEMYRNKFGFPFILAIRHATKDTVMGALHGRIGNPREVEIVTALEQIHKIAWMRILSKLESDKPSGFLTCHVLDTANGCPASKMKISLYRITTTGGNSTTTNRELISNFITNDDGRLEGGPALKNEKFQVGVYEWIFYVGDYFASKGTYVTGTPFLDEIPLRFGIDNPDDHYHVPLLVSPWSYSTYRGS